MYHFCYSWFARTVSLGQWIRIYECTVQRVHGPQWNQAYPNLSLPNGLAERAVQTFKSTVSKLEGSINVRLARFLLTYRVTPQTTTGLSPAELLMGRRIRIRLDLLHPDTSKTVIARQQRLISHKKPRKFKLGDKLYAKNFHGEKWIPVTVIKLTGPLLYQVQTDAGIVLCRHVDHLRFCYPNDNTRSLMV